jgi:hypothetical protein
MAILMASDHSWTAILDQILVHTSMTIEKEVNTWAKDEGACQWNILRPQIREVMENFYKARTKQIHVTQEAQAIEDGKTYYSRRLAERKKDADAQLKQKLAAYCAEKQADMPVEPKDSTSNSPPTDLLCCLMDCMDQLECKLSETTAMKNTHPPQPKRTPMEAPPVNPQLPLLHPQADTLTPPQNAWATVPSKHKPSGKKKTCQHLKSYSNRCKHLPQPTECIPPHGGHSFAEKGPTRGERRMPRPTSGHPTNKGKLESLQVPSHPLVRALVHSV